MLSSRIQPCTCQGGLSLTITHFLYWLESPHCFQNRKSPCIPTNNKFPLGVLIILNTQNLAGAELREAKTDVPGLEKKKTERMESRPPKSVEISIRQVWIGRLSWCEMLQDTCSFSLQIWAHVVGYITSAWGNAIIRVSCLTSRVIALFKLLRRCLWSHLLSHMEQWPEKSCSRFAGLVNIFLFCNSTCHWPKMWSFVMLIISNGDY